MATILQKNIDRLMDQKGMMYYTDLLIAIAKVQGMKQDKAIEFATKEKSNFSKMLKGERPLKYDYIIPLEKIFGISLAKLLEDQPYFDSIDKDDIPYLKSFRYFAYKDDPKLFNELDTTYTVDGSSYLNNSDEFNRFYLDYLIEYRAFNGLKHLVEKHNFKLNPVNDKIYQTDDETMIFSTMPIQIAKFVIDSNDVEIFNKVYDPFAYLMRFAYREAECLYTDEVFIEAVLNNEKIFHSLFEEREYPFDFINHNITPKNGEKPSIFCVNPLLNLCLEYCLNNVKQYKNQTQKILGYGITYNEKVLGRLQVPAKECQIDQFGNVYVGWHCYLANLIYTNKTNSGDAEIDKLIQILPKLHN